MFTQKDLDKARDILEKAYPYGVPENELGKCAIFFSEALIQENGDGIMPGPAAARRVIKALGYKLIQ